MKTLFDLPKLEERLAAYVQDMLGLPEHAAEIPIAILRRGEMARGDARRVTGTSERTARAALNALVHAGLLSSETPKTPVRQPFPVSSTDALFPRLFGAQAIT